MHSKCENVQVIMIYENIVKQIKIIKVLYKTNTQFVSHFNWIDKE